MNLVELTEVWTVPSAVIALISGALFGLMVGWAAINPSISAGIWPAKRTGFLAGFFAASAGLFFFAFQTLGSYLSNDPQYTRVMSRYGPWLLFSLTIGAMTWLLVRRDRARRRRVAHDKALAESGRPR